MSAGLYLHRQRNAGEIVDAPMYNGAHQNQLNNDIPTSAGGESDTLTLFRTTLDPTTGDGVTANPVADVGSEIEQLRFVIADIKTALNSGTPPTQWYSTITAPSFSLVQAHGARVFNDTVITIPHKTSTPLSMNNVRYDTGVVAPTFDPFFSLTHPTRLTASKAGLYHVWGLGSWSAGGTAGAIALFLVKNGTQVIGGAETTLDGQVFIRTQQVDAHYLLAQGDYVELVAFQDVGVGTYTISTVEFGLELLNVSGVVAPPTLFALTVAEAGSGTGTVAWTPTNNGSTSPENFVSGTVVTLTATPTFGVFSGWSGDVPVGHENDNPLTVTMDQNRSLTATFQALSVFFTVGANGPSTTLISPTSTNTFFDLGSGQVVSATIGNTQRRMPNSIVVTHIEAELSVALTGAEAVDIFLNRNGTTDTGITLHIDSSGTYFTADGTVTLSQDELVCWEAKNFAGGLTTLSFTHITFTYKPATATDGFVLGRQNYSTVGASTDIACFAANGAAAVNARTWVPKNITVKEATIVADSATGAGTATILTLKKNDNTTTLGGAVTLSDPATSVRATVGGTIPGTTTGAATDNHDFQRSSTGSPATVNARHMFSYLAAAPDAAFSFFHTGRPLFNHTTGAGGTVFLPLFGFSVASAPPASESAARMRWPTKGKFKYFGASGFADVGTTVQVTLRINGVSKLLTLAFTGASATWQQDYVTEVTVNAGDYVDYVAVRTAGAGTGFGFNGFIGFEAT